MLTPVLFLRTTIQNPDWKLKLMLVRCRHEEKWEIMEEGCGCKDKWQNGGGVDSGQVVSLVRSSQSSINKHFLRSASKLPLQEYRYLQVCS